MENSSPKEQALTPGLIRTGELFGLAWQEARERYSVMLPLSLVSVVVAMLLAGLGALLYSMFGASVILVVYAVVAVVVGVAISISAEAGNIYTALHAPKTKTFYEALRFGSTCGVVIFFIGLLFGLGVGLGLVLLIAPGLWVATTYGMALFIAVDERLGVWAAFARSKQLTAGFRWQIFTRMLALGVAYLIIGVVFNYVFSSFVEQTAFMQQYSLDVGSLVQVLLAPWYIMYFALLYKSLKEVHKV